VANTRRGYTIPLNRMACDFGADAKMALLDPDRVAGWFTFVWGGRRIRPSTPSTSG
jgi:integrase/recombinase XerC/integrase/recombinase XerD